MSSLTIDAPAKLNLFLYIGKKRKDSYHDLVTIFERIDLTDSITLTELKENRVEVDSDSSDIPLNRGNIAYKAALAVKDKFRIRNGVKIYIRKRIPVSAGLGGGSSDAAGTILGLVRLWGIKTGERLLFSLGAGLGADVPFFLKGVSFAIGRGIGEKLIPLNDIRHKFWHVLAVPRVSVSTRSIYEGFDKLRRDSFTLTKAGINVKLIHSALRNQDLKRIPGFLYNGLEKVTFKNYSRVFRAREFLRSRGGKAVLMSGSGPSVFALFKSKGEASDFKEKIRSLKGCRLFLTVTR